MNFWDLFSSLFKQSGQDQPSSQDWLPKSSITYYEGVGRLTIDLTKLNVLLSKPPRVWYPGIVSKSLDPVVDVTGHLVYIAGADEADHKKLVDALKVGDIAAYRFPADMTKPATAYITHRIVKITERNGEREFTFKGDNNSTRDPFAPKTENIKWIKIIVVD